LKFSFRVSFFFILALVVFVYSVDIFPQSFFDEIGHLKIFSVDFDSQNIITWQYEKYLGLMPIRDFWYPYSGHYLFSLPFPPDLIFRWIYRVTLFVFSICSLYVLFDKSWKDTLIVLAFWTWLYYSSVIFHVDRYYLAFALFLAWSATIYSLSNMFAIVSGIFTALAFFIEPTQFFAAIFPGLLLMMLFFINPKVARFRRKFYEILISYLLATLIGLFVLVIFLINKKIFEDAYLFYTNLSSFSVYASWPLTIQSIQRLNIDSVMITFSALCLLYGVSRFKINQEFEEFFFSSFIISLSMLTFFLFYKYSVRPHMAKQIAFIPIFSILYILLKSEEAKLYGFKKGMVFIAVFLFFIFFHNVKNEFIYNLKSIPNSLNTILEGSQIDSHKELYFSRKNFKLDGVSTEMFYHEIHDALPDFDNNFFVFGDDPFIYVIFRAVPFKHITFYDSSPVDSQIDLVNEISFRRPKYVIWKPEFKVFDAVPNMVRNPLIFKHIIHNYKYLESMGSYDVLILKDNYSPVDYGYWIDKLGETINLGFIPSLADSVKDTKCNHSALECDTYLKVDVDNVDDNIKNLKIIFNVEQSKIITVSFNLRKNQKNYFLKLNRLWFWDDIKKSEVRIKGERIKCSLSYLTVPRDEKRLY
jgi:hypothetical protein